MRFYRITDDDEYEYYGVTSQNKPFFWFDNRYGWRHTSTDDFEVGQVWKSWVDQFPKGCFCKVSRLEVIVQCGSLPKAKNRR